MENINKTNQQNANRFDKYCIWNLMYSITLTIMAILLIVYFTIYNSKITFLQFGNVWFWLFFGATITFTSVFLLINICFSIFKLIIAIKTKKNKHIIFYSLGLIIPYIGLIFDQINKDHISINSSKTNTISKNKIIIRKTLVYTSLCIGSIILLFPSLIVGFVFTQYNPPIRMTLNISDDRSSDNKSNHNQLKVSNDNELTSYSALSYNVGFNAYNQDMDFFMDMKHDGGKSKSRAQSKNAVFKSEAGVARILSASHDMVVKTNNHDLTIAAEDLRGSSLYKTYYDQNLKVNKDEVEENIQEFNNSLNSEQTGTFDFIAIQEQDLDSTRSYHINEYQRLRNDGYSEIYNEPNPNENINDNFANHYSSVFAYNFSVPWIPVPIHQMHGQVQGGLSIFSKYTMLDKAERVTLPNISTFPLNIFELKRCLIITRYPVNNGKEFVFINVHFFAYDSSGSVRRQQLGLVNQVFQEEINKGNYVMLGADWNQILPQTYGYSGSDTKFKNEIIYDNNDPAIAPFPFKEFKWWKCDPSKPTNDLCWKDYPTYEKNKSYKKGEGVYFESENDPTFDHICTNYIDKMHPNKHLYSPLVDEPSEEPVIYNTNTGKYEKSSQWRYYDTDYYWDTSLSNRILDELLPVAGTQNNQAKILTTHAIPTVRDAGINFRTAEDGYTNLYSTSIDGFLVSNNIGVNFTFGFDTEFIYSDHNPVGISFYLRS